MFTKKIEVIGQSFTVNYPNVGQFIEIKVTESQLSKGQLMGLLEGTPDQKDAFLFIRTFAYFRTLCPDLLKQLKVDNILDLSIVDFEELVKVYLNDIQPWVNDITKQLREKTILNDSKE